LTIEKEVWIDGVLQQGNEEIFSFTVDGETVTASAIEAGQIELETGSYVVTETQAMGITHRMQQRSKQSSQQKAD